MNENEEGKNKPEYVKSRKYMIFGGEPLAVSIPPIFCDSITEQPYTECLICKENLENKAYKVNKVFKKYPALEFTETILEMAICNHCAINNNIKISEESKKTMMEFFGSIDFIGRAQEIKQNEGAEQYEKWIEKCLVSNEKRSDIVEYQLVGAISEEGKLKLDHEIFMISGEVIEALNEKLSPETRQEFDDFAAQHFGVPPELLFEDQPKLLLV